MNIERNQTTREPAVNSAGSFRDFNASPAKLPPCDHDECGPVECAYRNLCAVADPVDRMERCLACPSRFPDWRRIAQDLETALVFVKCDLSEELFDRGITGEKWHSLISADKAIAEFNEAIEEEGRRCDVPAFEGKKLKQELAAAKEIVAAALRALPVGYIPNHPPENLASIIKESLEAAGDFKTESETSVDEPYEWKELYNLADFDWDTMPEAGRRRFRELVLEAADKALERRRKRQP